MRIAVEGCAHGELDTIYDAIKCLEEKEKFKTDLLICCGDFQSSRNQADLHCMAVPPKYRRMCSFYKYYNGEKLAPVLTIFIGGNHEASNYLQELPYGGWVAPNIYYLGYAGVINIAGVRIAGISGIYKSHDYMKGHFESPPYDDGSKRSVYHIRNLEVFRLKQLSQPINIFLSHDWPTHIYNYGDKEQLMRFKPFFRDDIESEELGSKPCEELLNTLQPDYWFAAHLHCKFAALVPHKSGKSTKFLALDKCLPKRRFLQIVDIAHNPDANIEISLDLEWISILKLTNYLLSVKSTLNFMPGPNSATKERWNFTPTDDEKIKTSEDFGGLKIPENFAKTVEGYKPADSSNKNVREPFAGLNPQTTALCEKLGIDDPLRLVLNYKSEGGIDSVLNSAENSFASETFINDTDVSQMNESPIHIKKLATLSLPEPVNSADDTFGVDNEVRSSKKAEEEEEEIIGASILPEETAAPAKKFKRRNATMYLNDVEDI